MADFLPVKPIYTGTDVTGLGEAQPGDTMVLPDGGMKFPDGSIQVTAASDGAQGPAGPTAVSADPGNISRLGGDGLLFTPQVAAVWG